MLCGLLGNDCLASGRVSRHEHGLVVLETQNSLFLKRIEREWVLLGGHCVRVDLERLVLDVVGYGHLVTASVQARQLEYTYSRQFFTLTF